MSSTSKSSRKLALLIAVFVCGLSAPTQLVEARYSRNEAMMYCLERTGLSYKDIRSTQSRNEDCAIDCITKQGTVQTVWAKDGKKCHDLDDYKCVLGKCRSPEEQAIVDTSDLNTLEIRILSAHVPDMDYLPTAGGSDTFITIHAGANARPAYSNDEIICHTYVVQDNNNPRWTNFVCRPMPMRSSALLKFSAFDSDKPIEIHDQLGVAEENVEYLMNQGPKKLPLIKGNQVDTPYWVVVEVKGKNYTETSDDH